MRPVRPARCPSPGHRALTPTGLLSELGIDLDPQLYQLALTHRSYAYEHGALPHNERLEFLGDAVLGLVVAEYLFRSYPDFAEGRLAKLRAAVVNAHSLAQVARSIGLGEALLLGKGEVSTGGRDKHSILADALEAFFGAVLIGSGQQAADQLLHHLFDPLVDDAVTKGSGLDWKTSLQELCSAMELGLPFYRIAESGPDHDKRFTATVLIGEQEFAPGHGRSKKQAEQLAAEAAHRSLQPQQ